MDAKTTAMSRDEVLEAICHWLRENRPNVIGVEVVGSELVMPLVRVSASLPKTIEVTVKIIDS